MTTDEECKKAFETLPAISVIDLGLHHGWGWRCKECKRGHVEDEAQEGGILTCEGCGKEYVCE